MDERKKFVSDWLKEDWNVAALCEYYGISRKTGYKWLGRFRSNGETALCDRSRAPKSHPNATQPESEAMILAFRAKHPHWGPRKLLHRLERLYPELIWPAASTIGAIIHRHGLAGVRRRRRLTPAYRGPLCEGLGANDVWAADFKGWFRTRDGQRVDPFTLSDVASRFLLRCQAVQNTGGDLVRSQFTAAFQQFGLPRSVRTDNGAPFASTSLGGVSRLAVWLVRLGITPERIRPGHPEENGVHERMHRTLKQETAKPPQANATDQQLAFDRFRTEFNDERPHESLEMRTPADVYQASSRVLPERLPELEYPANATIRRVRHDGYMKWSGKCIFLSEVLAKETIGLIEVDNGRWEIRFGPLQIGHYDLRTGQIQRPMRV